MKIQGGKPPEGKDIHIKVQRPNKDQAVEKTSTPKKSAGTADRVDLSGKAKEINKLKALINQLPDIRTEEIEAIKKAIETGNYTVDSLKVAEKILEEM